jgi:hypothetical protein
MDISEKEANRNIKQQKELIEWFKGIKKRKEGEYEQNKRQEQPVIDAIQNLDQDWEHE